MAFSAKIFRPFSVLLRNFHCKIEDTYPWDAPRRHKPKVSPPADYELMPGMSPKVFRETDYELCLGPIRATGNAAKETPYKNPEYFSYHQYSFYDIGRAIGCAYRVQPSALPKKAAPFRVPWRMDEVLPTERDESVTFGCHQCSRDDEDEAMKKN